MMPRQVMGRADGHARGFDAVASLVQRLAVLAGAGIPAVSAWGYVAEHSPGTSVDDIAQEVVDGLTSAQDLADRIAAAAARAPESERSAWASLAAVWATATDAGAALAPTLERSAAVLRSLADSAREVEVALAGPVATSRIVLALPGIGVLLGVVLGFDMVGAFASAPGVACLVGGTALIVAGVRWNRRLIRWARDLDATPGLGCELLAIALSGGGSVDRASALAVAASARAGVAVPGQDAAEVVAFAADAGVPVVGLLRAHADEQRRAARAEAGRRAAELENRMLLPLGLCVLPAFVLLGVVPVGLAILSSTALAL